MFIIFVRRILMLILILVVIQSVAGLKCFTCSEFDQARENTQDCPRQDDDPIDWSSNPQRYGNIRDDGGGEVVCAVGFDINGGRVYYQQGLLRSKCEDATFATKIKSQIGRGGEFKCCKVDGCNWNSTNARRGIGEDDWRKTSNAGFGFFFPDSLDPVPFILIGLVCALLIGCCICYCCICLADRRKEEDDEDDDGDSYLGQTASAMQTFNDGNAARGAHVPIAGRNRTILPPEYQDPGIEILSNRDHERWSAIDRRLYHKNNSSVASDLNSLRSSSTRPTSMDEFSWRNQKRIGEKSRHIFDNADIHSLPKPKKDKEKIKEEWKNIWSIQPVSPTKPEKKQNANPFRFMKSA